MFSALLAFAALPTVFAGDKPQVFIMMGQSNMLGEGDIGTGVKPYKPKSLEDYVHNQNKFQYLIDPATGNWTTDQNVRTVESVDVGNKSFAPSSIKYNQWMSPAGMSTIGPELGMGHSLSQAFGSAPKTMLLKSCIGNRALGWDLLPPTSEQWDCTTPKGVYTYAGYHDSPENWPKGTTPKPIGWEAGEQYDGDLGRADGILGNLSTYFPDADGYEVAGFMWWQGDRDHYDQCLANRYELNLVRLIQQLRLHYKVPNAKFVTASLGQTVDGATSTDGVILTAMKNVADFTKHPELGKDSVGFVYTHPLLCSPGSSSAHYGGDACTYMQVGEAMGAKMVELLKATA